MLYGVSPSPTSIGKDLGLVPVMRFMSTLMAIHTYPHPIAVGYGGHWQSKGAPTIGMISAGYGDGYPRHISSEAYVWVKGCHAPIVGRVSMDMMAIDLTHCPEVAIGDPVELWGIHVPVEQVAIWAGTIGYELLCQTSNRVRGD
jgi:alanine racemase